MNRRQALTGFAAAAAATALISTDRASAAPATPTSSGRFPWRIDLPDRFGPEGITIGRAPFAYFGSLADGSIYRASLVTGEGEVIVAGPGAGFPSVGLKIDHRGRLFVAGGNAGQARVIDVVGRRLLATYQFTTGNTFINDVVLTPVGPFFTDSFNPNLYHIPLGRHGKLPPADTFVRVPLSGDWQQAGMFNANGIVRTPDGTALLVVNSGTERLYRVNPRTGVATLVDLGGYAPTGGDGLLLEGRTLYVVQNSLNTLAVIRLAADGRSGTLVEAIQLDPDDFDVPTTVAAFRDRLYLVNARFRFDGSPMPTEFWAQAIPRP